MAMTAPCSAPSGAVSRTTRKRFGVTSIPAGFQLVKINLRGRWCRRGWAKSSQGGQVQGARSKKPGPRSQVQGDRSKETGPRRQAEQQKQTVAQRGNGSLGRLTRFSAQQ